MQTSLVIMAAGIGSRYGGGIKQLEHMGNRNLLKRIVFLPQFKLANFNYSIVTSARYWNS